MKINIIYYFKLAEAWMCLKSLSSLPYRSILSESGRISSGFVEYSSEHARGNRFKGVIQRTHRSLLFSYLRCRAASNSGLIPKYDIRSYYTRVAINLAASIKYASNVDKGRQKCPRIMEKYGRLYHIRTQYSVRVNHCLVYLRALCAGKYRRIMTLQITCTYD